MREHPDFAFDNPSRDVNTTVPQFRVVRQQEKRTVLVLDISGSMAGSRIEILAQVISVSQPVNNCDLYQKRRSHETVSSEFLLLMGWGEEGPQDGEPQDRVHQDLPESTRCPELRRKAFQE